nr:MAG TPA: hypothetical protein [Caudoviricetes sp.]
MARVLVASSLIFRYGVLGGKSSKLILLIGCSSL